MVQAAHIDAAGRKALRLILQGRLQFRRRLIPFGLVVDFEDVSVRIVKLIGRTVAEFVFDPTDPGAGVFQRLDAPRERLRAACAKGRVAEKGGVGRGQFERIALVVVPAAQINGIPGLAADRHAQNVAKEREAFVGFRRHELEMAEMRDVHDGLFLHGLPPSLAYPPWRSFKAFGARLSYHEFNAGYKQRLYQRTARLEAGRLGAVRGE